MRRDMYLEHLRKIPMFSACSDRELALLGRLVEQFDFPEGAHLVEEGRPGHEFFVIVSGRARVTRRGETVAELGPGDAFGELALLDTAPRNATVTADTAMCVATLGNREFAGALADIPSLSRKVMVGMARRLHELDARVGPGTVLSST